MNTPKSKGICYIVGAGSVSDGDFRFEKKAEDLIIAADAGWLHLKKAGVRPDLLVADFDSMEAVSPGCPLIRLPVVKDDTDTVYAVKAGLERGYRRFVLLGSLGGKRLSHTVANISLLAWIREAGGTGELRNGETVVRLFGEGEKVVFGASETGIVSLFAYSERAAVSIRGLQYAGDRIELNNAFPLGVSNHLTGRDAEIEVKEGLVLLIRESEG